MAARLEGGRNQADYEPESESARLLLGAGWRPKHALDAEAWIGIMAA